MASLLILDVPAGTPSSSRLALTKKSFAILGSSKLKNGLMFETHYNELWLATDAIAERIRALGLPVKATYGELTQLSAIEETVGVPKDTDMVRLLVRGHETLSQNSTHRVSIGRKSQR